MVLDGIDIRGIFMQEEAHLGTSCALQLRYCSFGQQLLRRSRFFASTSDLREYGLLDGISRVFMAGSYSRL